MQVCSIIVKTSRQVVAVVQSTGHRNHTDPIKLNDRVVHSKLTIYNAALSDTGTYRCTATTHDGKTNSTSAHVQVYSETIFA